MAIVVELKLRDSSDLIKARLAARELVAAAGLGSVEQTRFATAISELGRNAITYARDGMCRMRDRSDERRVRIEAEFSDSGPGIADLDLAMQDGYSTAGSLGAGLPGAKRLVDVFEISSTPAGTIVRVEIVCPRRR